MDIQGIQATQISQPTIERKESGLSLTDLKTHALVVLSYLLIGIGILIACSSPYIAFTIHPMVGLAAPVGPVALGILGLQRARGDGVARIGAPALPYVPGQPPGFNNGGDNCWMNALLQMIFNGKSYKKALQEWKNESFASQTMKALNPYFGIYPILNAFSKYNRTNTSICPVDTQDLRLWTHNGKPSVSPNIDHQEDPIDALELFHKKAGLFLPIVEKEGAAQEKSAGVFFITLFPEANRRTFNKMFDGFFHHVDKTNNVRKWFTKAPEGLVVQFPGNLASDNSMKEAKPSNVSMTLQLTKEQCPAEQASYSPDSFIVHHGISVKSGHYTAYIKRNGSWWHCDDKAVRQVSYWEVTSKIKEAYLIHYAKN